MDIYEQIQTELCERENPHFLSRAEVVSVIESYNRLMYLARMRDKDCPHCDARTKQKEKLPRKG